MVKKKAVAQVISPTLSEALNRITELKAICAQAEEALRDGRRGDAIKLLHGVRAGDQVQMNGHRQGGSAA